MKLGLVCMKKDTKMKKGFTGINAYNKCDNPIPKLVEATLHNISETKKCLEWVIENKTGMYRFSSDLIPFSEFWDWGNNLMIKHRLDKLRNMCKNNNIRTTIHPSQFCVINSENPKVVENSINILKQHAKLCELLDIDVIIVHTGSSKGDYKKRFIEVCNSLPKNIKSRICLENCHKIDILSILQICRECDIRPILDLHHNRICGKINLTDEIINAIISMWGDKKPVGHISSGKQREDDKAHNDFITDSDIELFEKFFSIFDLEIEAKNKDEAITTLLNKLNRRK